MHEDQTTAGVAEAAPRKPEVRDAATPPPAPASVRRGADLLAAASGCVWAVCWMTPFLAPLIPLWFVLLFLGFERVRSGREALRLGAISGIAQYVVGSHFLLALNAYSALGTVIYLIAIVYILPFAAGGTWLAYRFERATGIPRQAAFALIFPVMERLHAASPASLPADMIAHAFGGRPAWLAMSAWVGPFGVTLWSSLVGLLLWGAWRERARPARARRWLLGTAVLFALPLAVGLAAARTAPPPAKGAPFKVAIVQPSLTLEQKLNPERAQESWALLEELTLRTAKGVDLILWGETMRPSALVIRAGEPVHDPDMERIAAAAGAPILYGTVIARRNAAGDGYDGLFNGAALAYPDGRPGAWYGKQQLVPFVEGVPFASLIGYRPAVQPGKKRSWLTLMGNFSPGPEPTIFEVGGARIGVLICYEGLYPGYAREYREAGANLLAVLVNDAWWGRTFFSPWHARMLAARARENDVPVVRAGNSGVSCAMDADGTITAETGIFEVATLAGEVRLAGGGPTLYSRTGDVVLALLVLTLAVVAVVRRRRPDAGAA